ncbi:MAG: M23 family metallopeptidase [Chitinophagaceae bacterium]|nr:MAG: M23 family metallopeptidase [Chitinophagaceae bacterium]
MRKAKYVFNTQTLKYEKVQEGWGKFSLKVLGFLSATIMFAVIIVSTAYNFFQSPKEIVLQREVDEMRLNYQLVERKLVEMEDVVAQLQDRDDNIYRVIFESEPIPKSVRSAGVGGSLRYQHLEGLKNSGLMMAVAERIDKIRRQLYIQSKSYDEVTEMLKNKSEMLASIPAIQPISNADLTRIASGFGYRIHPIYKTRRLHQGIDFTAPTGTEVYSTGNGVIESVVHSNRGYGNHIIINHGYGYKTLYAHLSRFNVRRGQTINRGDIIGYVGNTGLSTAPHLHYEVIKDGNRIDPINFFYNDLTPEEFDKVVELASRHNQSFD